MTRTAWFHCFGGTAGDMTLAALVDAGADIGAVAELVARLPVDGYALSVERVARCGLAATQAHVVIDPHRDGDHDHRPSRAIRDIIDRADLPRRVADRSHRTFAALATVEAGIHGVPVDDVELHEVGSLDAIVDVVGSCAALEVLGIDRIVCSQIAVGTGTIHAAHGQLPNPSPAVVALLARRAAPARGIDDHRELATPTGVALMTALADGFGPMPSMDVAAVGYGAGAAEIEGRPNVVQVVIGEQHDAPLTTAGQPVRLIETNVDDVTGEVIAHAIAALIGVGAHDAWATPIVMKKGRPATTVHALCDPAVADAVITTMVRETGTLGVRGSALERWPQHREERTIVLDGQPIAVKVTDGRVKVEHDDAARAAAILDLPLREVLHRAAELASGDR